MPHLPKHAVPNERIFLAGISTGTAPSRQTLRLRRLIVLTKQAGPVEAVSLETVSLDRPVFLLFYGTFGVFLVKHPAIYLYFAAKVRRLEDRAKAYICIHLFREYTPA